MNILEHFDHPGRKQDKEHFSHLIQMAMADGKIDDSELKILFRLGLKLGFTSAEIDDLLEINRNSAYIPPYELSKRFEQLYEVFKMAYADGVIDHDEMLLATGLAYKSGFTEQEIPDLFALLMEGIKKGEDEDDLFTLYKKRRILK